MQWRSSPGGYLREVLTAKVYDVAVETPLQAAQKLRSAIVFHICPDPFFCSPTSRTILVSVALRPLFACCGLEPAGRAGCAACGAEGPVRCCSMSCRGARG